MRGGFAPNAAAIHRNTGKIPRCPMYSPSAQCPVPSTQCPVPRASRSIMPQGDDWILCRGAPGGVDPEDQPDRDRDAEGEDDGAERDVGGQAH